MIDSCARRLQPGPYSTDSGSKLHFCVHLTLTVLCRLSRTVTLRNTRCFHMFDRPVVPCYGFYTMTGQSLLLGPAYQRAKTSQTSIAQRSGAILKQPKERCWIISMAKQLRVLETRKTKDVLSHTVRRRRKEKPKRWRQGDQKRSKKASRYRQGENTVG